jgi:hypothetical protein
MRGNGLEWQDQSAIVPPSGPELRKQFATAVGRWCIGEIRSHCSHRLFTEVDALNRGLDRIHVYRGPGNEKEFETEYGRNRIKAENILQRFQDAKDAICSKQ